MSEDGKSANDPLAMSLQSSSPKVVLFKGDKISLRVLQLRFLFGDVELATGTGFIHQLRKSFYLITNWHNVSGRNPLTGDCLSNTLGVPDRITTRFRPTPRAPYWRTINIPLYLDTKMETPRWWEHPIHGRNVDVVAIPLPENCTTWLDEHDIHPINSIQFNNKYPIRVTDDCYVVGFPFREEPRPLLPIWKKASVASEPDIDLDDLPKLLIDTATRSGLSGSPVIMRRVGFHGLSPDGSIPNDAEIGEIQRFLGIYSNRIGKNEEFAQLGVVWKSNAIEEILSKQKDQASINENS